MGVFVLGLDGATWDVLGPLIDQGELPVLARLREQGVFGSLRSVVPPLSPVAWTGVMTGKNPGKHGVFEFLEFDHDPLGGRVNTSGSIEADLLWEIAGRYGKRTVAGGVPLSYPPRPAPGSFILGDFLSPPEAPDLATDPELLKELEEHLGEPYRPWDTSVHDGGREAEALASLTGFLDHHLKAVRFLMERTDWDVFMYDLMATDRLQHELWHAWQPEHRVARGRDLSAIRRGWIDFWKRLDEAIGAIDAALPEDTNLVLLSDHGFGPVEWFVNFNVWLLERGYIQLKRSPYVAQKHWCYRRGITPAWIYGLMARFGGAEHRVGRFRGKQRGPLDRIGESIFLSRRHIDWSRTRAYAQGNFGQIFLNLKGRQPEGCVEPDGAPELIARLKADLQALRHPETGEPLVERVYERDELYQGPRSDRAPDLTVVPRDWRCRTIGLHDFTTHEVIGPAFGPTGDHRMDGVLIARGPAFRSGARLETASLLDIAPTVLHLLGVPVPEDVDGRVIDEALDPAFEPEPAERIEDSGASGGVSEPSVRSAPPSADHEEEVRRRLADLGYL